MAEIQTGGGEVTNLDEFVPDPSTTPSGTAFGMPQTSTGTPPGTGGTGGTPPQGGGGGGGGLFGGGTQPQPPGGGTSQSPGQQEEIIGPVANFAAETMGEPTVLNHVGSSGSPFNLFGSSAASPASSLGGNIFNAPAPAAGTPLMAPRFLGPPTPAPPPIPTFTPSPGIDPNAVRYNQQSPGIPFTFPTPTVAPPGAFPPNIGGGGVAGQGPVFINPNTGLPVMTEGVGGGPGVPMSPADIAAAANAAVDTHTMNGLQTLSFADPSIATIAQSQVADPSFSQAMNQSFSSMQNLQDFFASLDNPPGSGGGPEGGGGPAPGGGGAPGPGGGAPPPSTSPPPPEAPPPTTTPPPPPPAEEPPPPTPEPEQISLEDVVGQQPPGTQVGFNPELSNPMLAEANVSPLTAQETAAANLAAQANAVAISTNPVEGLPVDSVSLPGISPMADMGFNIDPEALPTTTITEGITPEEAEAAAAAISSQSTDTNPAQGISVSAPTGTVGPTNTDDPEESEGTTTSNISDAPADPGESSDSSGDDGGDGGGTGSGGAP